MEDGNCGICGAPSTDGIIDHQDNCFERGQLQESLWTAITAVQVISELQKAIAIQQVSRPLAAAVMLRLHALTGELATAHNLPYTLSNSKAGQKAQLLLETLAAEIGWA